MTCIVESTIESIQNKNTIIFRLFATYIIILHIVNITITFNLVIISIKQLKLITKYSFVI